METYYVKLHGKANIPQRLGIGHNYRLLADCSVTQEQKIDNENGQFDVVFKMEPITVEIEKDNGEVVRAKDPRRNSQKVRNYLFKCYSEDGYPENFDDVYDAFIREVLLITPSLLANAIKKMRD